MFEDSPYICLMHLAAVAYQIFMCDAINLTGERIFNIK